jgi:autotransporter-associated beta strand protein
MKKTIAVGAVLLGLFAFADTTVTDDLALTSTLTLNVPEGETWTYSGVISGSSGIVKNGGGTLCLTGANTFTGGITVNEGTLDTSSATSGGWGTGTVTVNSTGTKVCRVVIRNTEVAPLAFTGPTTDQYEGIYVEESSDGCSELNGAITAAGDLYIKTYGADTAALMNTKRLTVGGTVTVTSPGRLALAPHCRVDFSGLVTADVLEGYWTANSATADGGNPGIISLNAYSNLITRIILDRTRLRNGASYSIAGSVIEWTGLHPEGGSVDMAGNAIWVRDLVTPAGMTEFEGTPYESSFEVFNSSSTARGLYLRDHPSGYVYARFGSNVQLSIVYNKQTLHFANRRHSLQKIVASDKVYIEGSTSFDKPFTFEVNNGQIVYLQTTGAKAFATLSGISLGSCQLHIKASALAGIPDDYSTYLSLNQNSHIYLDDGGTMRLSYIKDAYAGVDLAAGTWTASTPGTPLDNKSAARLASGTYVTATPVAETSSITWTGGGADTSVSTPENWGLVDAPDFSKYGVTATVPTADPTLTFPSGDTLLSGLVLNPQRPADGGTSTVTLEAADATSRLFLQSENLSFADHGLYPCTYVYDMTVPTYLMSAVSLSFSSNDVVTLDGALRGSKALKIGLGGRHNNYDQKTTGGILNFTGDNAHAGDITISNGVINVSGTLGVPGDTGTLTAICNYKVTLGGETWYDYGSILFTNATVNKAFTGTVLGMISGIQNQGDWLQFVGTNVMNGYFYVSSSHWVHTRDGTDITFAGGYRAGNGFTLYPPPGAESSAKVTFTKPWRGDNASKSQFFVAGAGSSYGKMHVVFACAGSTSKAYFDLHGNSGRNTFECTADDAISASNLYMRSQAVLTITNCTIRFPRFYSDSTAVKIEGKDGGHFMLTNGWTSAEVSSRPFRGTLEGDISLTMAGVAGRTQRLTGCVATSCGDVEVSGGTLEFSSNSSWLVGTNVTVRGTGTLKIGQSETFNKDFAVVRFEDEGKIEVPSGVVQKFAKGWVGDRELPYGQYTAANLPAHVSGAGVICIAGKGLTIIMR